MVERSKHQFIKSSPHSNLSKATSRKSELWQKFQNWIWLGQVTSTNFHTQGTVLQKKPSRTFDIPYVRADLVRRDAGEDAAQTWRFWQIRSMYLHIRHLSCEAWAKMGSSLPASRVVYGKDMLPVCHKCHARAAVSPHVSSVWIGS